MTKSSNPQIEGWSWVLIYRMMVIDAIAKQSGRKDLSESLMKSGCSGG